MTTNEILSFEKYSDSRIFSLLADIAEFNLVADIPPIPIWSDDIFSTQVTARLYETLRDVVQAAGFYNENILESARGIKGVEVSYPDDRYNFSLSCEGNQISIRRRGSRLSNFHNWYTSFMPSSQGVLTKTLSVLSEETGRKLDILRAGYFFKFLIYDIEAEATHKRVRNSEIMQKILKGFPDDQGMITDSPNVLGSLGRIDVDLSKYVGEEGRRRRLQFSVQAPGNLQYSTLWFTFAYIGETFNSPEDDHREPFNSGEFMTEFTSAYTTFLRDNAVNGFMEWLLRGYYFKSSSGILP